MLYFHCNKNILPEPMLKGMLYLKNIEDLLNKKENFMKETCEKRIPD